MLKRSGFALPPFAIAIYLCGISAAAFGARHGLAVGSPPQCFSDFDICESSFIGMTRMRTKAVTDVAVAVRAFNKIPHVFHVTRTNRRANTRKSTHLVHQTIPADFPASSSFLARRNARWLHNLAATAAPICHVDASSNVSYSGCRLYPNSLIYCCGLARTNCSLAFQKKWKVLFIIFHDISHPSIAPLPGLEVDLLAFDAGSGFILALSSSALISTRTLMWSHFFNFAVNQICPKRFIKEFAPAKISYFSALPSAETGTIDFRDNSVSQSLMETTIPYLIKPPVICSCFTTIVLRYYSVACINHETQNLVLVELITFARYLVITALLGFCTVLCCCRRRSFTMCQHLFFLHNACDVSFFRCPLGLPYFCARRKRRSPTKSSRDTTSSPSLGKCALICLIERIAAHLRIKCFAFWRCLVPCKSTIMILVLHFLPHPITNAQSCQLLMLGTKRAQLASTALPTGLMFFAGGEAGASSWLGR
jgi:hypothetical protein